MPPNPRKVTHRTAAWRPCGRLRSREASRSDVRSFDGLRSPAATASLGVLRLGRHVGAVARSPSPPSPARAGGLSPDDKALVDRATAYLESLNEDKGRFAQTDPHGNVTEGDLFLKRPGMTRFQYDPPSRLLVVSDGKTVRVVDPRLRPSTTTR